MIARIQQLLIGDNIKQVVVTMVVIVLLLFIGSLIPGIKHIQKAIMKYVIHPLGHYLFVETSLLLAKFGWWIIKYFKYMVSVYFFNLTHTNKTIYPALQEKQIGVIENEE